ALRGLRAAGRERARANELLQGALQHHAEVPRRRPLEAQEAAAALGGARGVARARGLDYILKVGGVCFGPAQLARGELEGARRRRDLEQRHHLLLQQDLSQEEVGVASEEAGPRATPMEGYLYKRASNAFRTWSR
ncbi:ACAP1 protein, partial [Sylvia borin]|nr:ACAP1 protein [Sylvia borin]